MKFKVGDPVMDIDGDILFVKEVNHTGNPDLLLVGKLMPDWQLHYIGYINISEVKKPTAKAWRKFLGMDE